MTNERNAEAMKIPKKKPTALLTVGMKKAAEKMQSKRGDQHEYYHELSGIVVPKDGRCTRRA